MLRFSAAPVAALCVLVGLPTAVQPAGAQAWDDPRTMALVERATKGRAEQLADSTLVDYRATAHGYLTFLVQLGQGFPDPPSVVKSDELALQVYWRAPDLSKQIIEGRRDTLLLPTDIRYHQDHLGIVQNNFPNFIRLGEGDEVRDVPHPLSADGLHLYDFAIRDSLAIRLGGQNRFVYEVAVRPRDESAARIVGAVYIDTASAQVVRMAFAFTHAAYLDKELEDISIVLENALVADRYWLPYRQDIEIRRTGTWLQFPARGIIRGRWDICCYDINARLAPTLFGGPEIVEAPSTITSSYHWTGRILDSLPADVRAPTEADVQRVQDEARALVRTEALSRAAGVEPAARRMSDVARVNRVEGLALGGGASARLGGGLGAAAVGRWGFDDHQAKGRGSVRYEWSSGRSIALFAVRDYRDAGDVPEVSPLVNSVAAQEFGSDRTDPYDVRGVGVDLALGRWAGADWSVSVAHEDQNRLVVHALPWHGAYGATLPAWSIREERAAVDARRSMPATALGDVTVHVQVRGGLFAGRDTALAARHPAFERAFAQAHAQRKLGADALVFDATAAGVRGSSGVPAQEYVFLGGPVSGPGYGYHEFAARFGATARAEWRMPVPFPAISLGAFGRTPASATLAPFVHTLYVTNGASFAAPARGWYPAVGVGFMVLFDLARFDVARGLRRGAGRWTFSFDLAPVLWRVL